MRRCRFDLALLLAALGPLAACRARQPEALVTQAEFGVFFGGQVQMLDQIPYELDRARQSLGFRLEFARALTAPVAIAWEFDMPNRTTVADAGPNARPGRALRSGSAEAAVGLGDFEQVLSFEPGDPLGTWNIRVRADRTWVIDRPFLVYDAEARARANSRDGDGR